MATWPITLPNPTRKYSLKPVNPVARTNMEGGPARQRRIYSQAPTDIYVTWEFTDSELAIFEKFHKNDIFDGASWFDGITLANGQGLTSYTARFKNMWDSSYIGFDKWAVSAVLEVNERPLNA